jgi:hypothetical protein
MVGTSLTNPSSSDADYCDADTWDEGDLGGGVIRLPARRSKTNTGRMLPISAPLRHVLDRRTRAGAPGDRRVFRRDGVPVRVWRYALRDACRKANVPHRLLHDCPTDRRAQFDSGGRPRTDRHAADRPQNAGRV